MTLQKTIDKLLNLYFSQPNALYMHLFDSYNQFISEIIPYHLTVDQRPIDEKKINDKIYVHEFKFNNIRMKPATFENDNRIMFPHDARKNKLNYFGSIIADVDQILTITDLKTNEKVIRTIASSKDYEVARVPIMVGSKYCTTQIKQDRSEECHYDMGGYFIIKGNEKVVLSMEQLVDTKS